MKIALISVLACIGVALAAGNPATVRALLVLRIDRSLTR